MKKPVIAISLGDPNGIGPEIILKSLDRKDVNKLGCFVVFCPIKLWQFYRKHFDINVPFKPISDLSEISVDKINVYDIKEDNFFVEFGVSSQNAGKVAFDSLKEAAKSVSDNKCDILVTAPINKSNIQSDEFVFPGHTEYLEKVWGGRNLMFMVHEQIKVGLVTQHIALKEVSSHINEEIVIDKFNLIYNSLVEDFNISKPVISVLGLNPHSGDNGLLGKEEIDVIIPAIKKLTNQKKLAYGPFPADSFFSLDNLRKYDGVLAMYHDQGLIPFKTIAGVEGVNYTAGLPYVRTSPDHGVGYDIAGEKIANEQSFVEAIYVGVDIFFNRYNNKKLKEEALSTSKK